MTEIPEAVYRDWSLADLDWLHEDQGLTAEWLASARRRQMVGTEGEGAA